MVAELPATASSTPGLQWARQGQGGTEACFGDVWFLSSMGAADTGLKTFASPTGIESGRKRGSEACDCNEETL